MHMEYIIYLLTSSRFESLVCKRVVVVVVIATYFYFTSRVYVKLVLEHQCCIEMPLISLRILSTSLKCIF